jgi:hypothetical protein
VPLTALVGTLFSWQHIKADLVLQYCSLELSQAPGPSASLASREPSDKYAKIAKSIWFLQLSLQASALAGASLQAYRKLTSCLQSFLELPEEDEVAKAFRRM